MFVLFCPRSKRMEVARYLAQKSQIVPLKKKNQGPYSATIYIYIYIYICFTNSMQHLSTLFPTWFRQWYDIVHRGASNDLTTICGFIVAIRDALRVRPGGLMHGGHPCGGFLAINSGSMCSFWQVIACLFCKHYPVCICELCTQVHFYINRHPHEEPLHHGQPKWLVFNIQLW